jgi:glycosyltransferase involved in cell wall biosynthesis
LEELGCAVTVLAEQSEMNESDPDVVSLQQGSSLSAYERIGLKVLYRFALHYAIPFNVSRRILDVLSQNRFDLLEMEESFGSSAMVAPRVDMPVVVRLHGPYFLTGRANGVANDKAYHRRIHMEGLGFRMAAGVSSPSRMTLAASCSFYCYTPPVAAVIPNPQPVAAPGLRWRLDTCDRNTILFVGRFDRIKGADLVIEAFASLARQYPRLRLKFVGPDNGLYDAENRLQLFRDYIATKVTCRQVQDRIEYLGFQSGEAISALRFSSFLTLVCSRYETFPYTALEAISQGCPVVSSDAGGLVEIFTNNETGLTFPSGDSRQLALRIARLIEDPSQASQLGDRALQDCAQRFNPALLARQTLEFYNEVLDHYRSR